jgi:hypothetical protein
MTLVFGATAVGPLLRIETSAEAAATAMLQLLVPVPAGDAESWALEEKGKVPAKVGVPMRSPVATTRLKPGGSDAGVGVMENVYGGVPPVAASKELYATPTWAVPSGQVTATAGGVMVVIGGPGLAIGLESNVTAPISAKALPPSVAPVVSVMDW